MVWKKCNKILANFYISIAKKGVGCCCWKDRWPRFAERITIWKINRDKCSFNKKAELEPNYACEHSAIKSVFYSYCLLFLWILIKLWKQENCEVHTYFQKTNSTKPQLMTILIDCNSDYSHSRIILRVNRFTRNFKVSASKGRETIW